MKPTMAKAHSKRHALEFVKLGWTLQTACRHSIDDEPYEYLLVWEKDEDPLPSHKDPNAWPQTRRPPRTQEPNSDSLRRKILADCAETRSERIPSRRWRR